MAILQHGQLGYTSTSERVDLPSQFVCHDCSSTSEAAFAQEGEKNR